MKPPALTLLPIVDRELRVAARRPATQWLRAGAALAVTLVWFGLMLANQQGGQQAQLGHNLIRALSLLAFGFALVAGVFLTADCLSAERREGTLGLLFLTDLTALDVALGKLAATSLHACYALLAAFPVLGLPLLVGGVSGGEFARLLLVLVLTLFFSLAAGLCVSAVNRQTQAAMGGSFILLAALSGILPALRWMLPQSASFLDPFLFWPSPGYAYWQAFDTHYGPVRFWGSVAVIGGLALLFVVLACVLLGRNWRESKSAAPVKRTVAMRKLQDGPGEKNPYAWLATRLTTSGRWAKIFPAVLVVIWATSTLLAFNPRREECFIMAFIAAYVLHTYWKCAQAIEATRRFSEDRASGALELLLSTPLAPATILAGQRCALARSFALRFALICAVNLGLVWLVHNNTTTGNSQERTIFTTMFLGGLVLFPLDDYALTWAGMLAGLRGSRHHRAVLVTLARVMLPGWVGIFIFVVMGFSDLLRGEQSVVVMTVIWIVLNWAWTMVVVVRAKRQLAACFRLLAAGENIRLPAHLEP